jgi:hypothetical protein
MDYKFYREPAPFLPKSKEAWEDKCKVGLFIKLHQILIIHKRNIISNWQLSSPIRLHLEKNTGTSIKKINKQETRYSNSNHQKGAGWSQSVFKSKNPCPGLQENQI